MAERNMAMAGGNRSDGERLVAMETTMAQHLDECTRVGRENAEAMRDMARSLEGLRGDVQASIGRVHTRIDETNKARHELVTKVGAGVILMLIAVVGPLFTRAIGWW